jgi:ribosome-binding protein aMBF1 (putative translation factor)
MIQNERQYRVTRAQAGKFARALRELSSRKGTAARVHPLLQKAQVEGLKSQLADLRGQLREYEALRAGRRRVPPVDALDDLPRRLVQARIAAGLTQKDLAERLGLKAQQIQRYEASGYASASLTRLRQVAAAICGKPAPRRRMRDAG